MTFWILPKQELLITLLNESELFFKILLKV